MCGQQVLVEDRDMRLSDRILVHQVHPAKISADVAASLVSNLLLWCSRPKAAVVVRGALPVAGSVAVLSLADLDALARTRRGRWVRVHMPPSAQAVRLVGDAVMAVGARRRSPALLITGALVVAAGWSHPWWARASSREYASSRSSACGDRTQGGSSVAQLFCGKPRFRPPWDGSSHLLVTTLVLVKKCTPSGPYACESPNSESFQPPNE